MKKDGVVSRICGCLKALEGCPGRDRGRFRRGGKRDAESWKRPAQVGEE